LLVAIIESIHLSSLVYEDGVRDWKIDKLHNYVLIVTYIILDAVVVRSAAGRVAPHLYNLLFLDQVLTFTDIMIIHHTGISSFFSTAVSAQGLILTRPDCSASMLRNNDVREVLKERAPGQSGEIDNLMFPGFDEYVYCLQDGWELLLIVSLALALNKVFEMI